MQDDEVKSCIEYYKDTSNYDTFDEEDGVMTFWVYGNPVPKGKTTRLCVLFPNAPGVPFDVIMRETKEEVINEFLNECYEHFLDELLNTIPEYLPEDQEIVWMKMLLEDTQEGYKATEKIMSKESLQAFALSEEMGLVIPNFSKDTIFYYVKIVIILFFSLPGLIETFSSFSLILFK